MERINTNPHGLSVSAYDPIAHGKMRADTINSAPGDLPDFDCPKCMNRGFHAHVREDGSLVIRDCTCKRIRKTVREMERSGLKNSIREQTFESYQVKAPWQEHLKNGAQRYAKDGKGWFLIGGQSGAGKTHLCTAICRQRLLEGQEVHYMSWRDTIAILKAMGKESDRREEKINACKKAGVLYIDDLYKTGKSADEFVCPSPADINIAFEILNYRYINRLPTVITTELTPEELVEIDEATGSRIIEMGGEHVYAIGRDRRKNYRLRSVVNL